ncbi:MAG: hypothetical protein CYG60_07035 [Actinobacteria bacterium]|nr:MAG: hypothetical protein CYG60_07035 [Actinomycetota bacterium]
MSALELLAALDRDGAEVGVANGRLRVGAYRDVLTPERVAALKTHKAELLALLGGLEPDEQEGHDGTVPRGYVFVDRQGQLEEVRRAIEASPITGFDTETTGLRWWKDRVRILSITTQAGWTFVIDVFAVDVSPLAEALRGTRLVAHNALFDVLFLGKLGIESARLSCTMVLSQILYAGLGVEHGLRGALRRELGLSIGKDQQRSDWSGPLTGAMKSYAAQDSKHLVALYGELNRKLADAGGLERVIDLEERLLEALVHMSRNGMPINPDRYREYVETARAKAERLLLEMDALVPGEVPEEYCTRNGKNKNVPPERRDKINWLSPEQMAWALRESGVNLGYTDRGNVSTDKDVLASADHPLAGLILEWRKAKDLPTRFGDALQTAVVDGNLYAQWNQNKARTGRMSCEKPPLQGVSHEGDLRRAFEAPEDYRYVVSDLSQIEVRVLAALAGDEKMIAAFGTGLDVYRQVAGKVLGISAEGVTKEQRSVFKTIVLGKIYGLGENALRKKLEKTLHRAVSIVEVREYSEGFFAEFPGVEKWRNEVAFGFDAGRRETRTWFGRRRLGVTNKPQAWNTPIQGLAADALKSIAAEVHERRDEVPGLKLVGLVHDEVLAVVPEEHARVAAGWLTNLMEGVADRVVNGDAPETERVPIKADTSVCKSWAEKGE